MTLYLGAAYFSLTYGEQLGQVQWSLVPWPYCDRWR